MVDWLVGLIGWYGWFVRSFVRFVDWLVGRLVRFDVWLGWLIGLLVHLQQVGSVCLLVASIVGGVCRLIG